VLLEISGFAMYNIAFTGILVLCTLLTVDLTQSNQVIFQSVGVLWASFFSSLAFVLPRLLQVQRHTRELRQSMLVRSTITSRHLQLSGLHSSEKSNEAVSVLNMRSSIGSMDRTNPSHTDDGQAVIRKMQFSDPFLSHVEHVDSTATEERQSINTKTPAGDHAKSVWEHIDSTMNQVDNESSFVMKNNHIETDTHNDCHQGDDGIMGVSISDNITMNNGSFILRESDHESAHIKNL
jgi:hypothetical protein